ncbi:MAG: VanZ family protein [Xanthomonadales bacterium]|nr:VanZ family protein [Xanthomonadales bacterium]
MQISRKYLVLIGWLLVVTIITLSLIRIDAAMPKIENSDKIGHFLAYSSLMAWFTWLYTKAWVRNLYALAFIIMGGLLELLQSMTSFRSADIADFQVNTIGVIIGFVFAVLTSNIGFIKKTFSL